MDNTWAPLGTSLHHYAPLENCMENTWATLGNFGVTWVNNQGMIIDYLVTFGEVYLFPVGSNATVAYGHFFLLLPLTN